MWLRKLFCKVVSNVAIAFLKALRKFQRFTGLRVDVMQWDVINRKRRCCDRGNFPALVKRRVDKFIRFSEMLDLGWSQTSSILNGNWDTT